MNNREVRYEFTNEGTVKALKKEVSELRRALQEVVCMCEHMRQLIADQDGHDGSVDIAELRDIRDGLL